MNEEIKEQYNTILRFLDMGEYDDPTLYYGIEHDIEILFSVIERIEGLKSQRLGGFVVKIEGSSTTIYSKNKTKKDSVTITHLGESKIDSIYHACFKFIEWYNKSNLK